jgi:hypothetical protein
MSPRRRNVDMRVLSDLAFVRESSRQRASRTQQLIEMRAKLQATNESLSGLP